jgi:hypothetical protein
MRKPRSKLAARRRDQSGQVKLEGNLEKPSRRDVIHGNAENDLLAGFDCQKAGHV